MCYVWAQSVLKEQDDLQDEYTYLQKYSITIPIILRSVTNEKTLRDIFISQLRQCLNICEICALVDMLEANPSQTLLLLDGFDEYEGGSVISKILNKEENISTLVLTTSRPYGVDLIKRNTGRAVEQHVKLCGFSESQITQYITQFFKNHPGKLKETLFSERPDLVEVAKTPIRCAMICRVWQKWGKLGNTLADLYELFVAQLIAHSVNKKDFDCQITHREVLKMKASLLMNVAKVSNTWNRNNRLHIIFGKEELLFALNNNEVVYREIKDIGLIIQSHPFQALEQSKWSFPHLTVQEYFVAYFLGENGNDECISEFSNRCKNDNILQKYEVIFMFLCSKYPLVAKKIFLNLVQEETDETKCMELLKFMSQQFKYLRESDRICLPLPQCVNIEYAKYINDKTLMNTVFKLLKSEVKSNKALVKSLTIRSRFYHDWIVLPFLKRLDILVCYGAEEKCRNKIPPEVKLEATLRVLAASLRKMTALECLYIRNKRDFALVDLFEDMSGENLIALSVAGLNAMNAVAKHIHKFPRLQRLHIDEKTSHFKRDVGYQLLRSLKGIDCLKQVSLCFKDVNELIIPENIGTGIDLKVTKVQKHTLLDIIGNYSQLSGSLCKMDLDDNNLEFEGDLLGQLIAKMNGLKILSLFRCNLQVHTLQAILCAVKQAKDASSIQRLNIGSYKNQLTDDLHTGGKFLGELIKKMPGLQILYMIRCNLDSSDLAEVSETLSQCDTIHTLNLKYNSLGVDGVGGINLLKRMRNIQNIRVGGSKNEDPTKAICGAVANDYLNNLVILDMSYGRFQSDSLKLLGLQLMRMDRLEVLNLGRIIGIEPEDYQHIYKHIPSSLKHLNVYTSSHGKYERKHLDPDHIINNKSRFQYLQKFNLWLPDTSIAIIQEKLEQINPTIHVYNDQYENIWKMCVLDKGQESLQ